MSRIGNFKKTNTKIHKPHMSFLLVIVIIAITVMIIIYMAKMACLSTGMLSGYGDGLMSLGMFIFELLMMFLMFNALLGVMSRKPKAWRKIVRSCLITIAVMFIRNSISFGTLASSLVVFSMPTILVIMVPAILIMFKKSIREYYTPPMMKTKPIWDWILYVGVKSLYPSKNFELEYSDDRSSDNVSETNN